MSKAIQVTAQDQTQNGTGAQYTLIEYGDYQCPSCGDAVQLVKQAQRHFGKKLQFVFRNFPLEQHQFAEAAAETAMFAAAKGKFWEMHDLLYERQDRFSKDLFPKLAEELGLDGAELTNALASGKYNEQVKADIDSGVKAGVHATPTFFVNGKQDMEVYDLKSLVEALETK